MAVDRRWSGRLGRPGAVQPSRQAGALAADHEDLPLVLDHAGMPVERTQDALGQWRRDLAAVAAEPNTMVKISALGTDGLPRRRICIRSAAVSPTPSPRSPPCSTEQNRRIFRRLGASVLPRRGDVEGLQRGLPSHGPTVQACADAGEAVVTGQHHDLRERDLTPFQRR
ncbi:amidohydrolase family protein [Streptomyces sp. NBC_01622]|uniref:amidohydrolase family protein n=1 Tax=Streptomyces sp. NBC_01622 TaxID=2975903 RepID=UPI003865802F